MNKRAVGKHTPGPWKIDSEIQEFRHLAGSVENIGVYAGLSPICEMAGHYNAKADAHLIASAPEMLEMLIAVADDLRSGRLKHEDNVLPEVEALIAKAEGRA